MDDAVEAQLAAYNRRDIDAFIRCYSEDCLIEDADGKQLMRGRTEMRARYRALFESSPELHAEITSRVRIGLHVIDEERITGRVSPEGSPPVRRAVAVYRLRDGLIDHVRFYRE